MSRIQSLIAMLIQHIIDILPNLYRPENSDSFSFDQSLAHEISDFISYYHPTQEVDDKLDEAICNLFAKRWSFMRDKYGLDYTMSPQAGSNPAWMEFAQKLCEFKQKITVQVLIPDFKNKNNTFTFEKIPGIKNIGHLFLSENDNIFFDIRSLHNALRGKIKLPQNQYQFVLYPTRDGHPRAISLHEFYRISISPHKAMFLEEFRTHVMPHWCQRGELPTEFLPSLLELVSYYYQKKRHEMTESEYLSKLRLFSKALNTGCSIEDTYHLFGQKIQVDDQSLYLLDILKELYHTENDNIVNALAIWIHQQDASLISADPALQFEYQRLWVGPQGFGIEQLKARVNNLLPEKSPLLDTRGIQAILQQCEIKQGIDSELFKQITQLYQDRWKIICSTGRCFYTQINAAKNNEPWIQLARDLKGAGWISGDYYCYLMSTVNHTIDHVTRDPLSFYPLSHYILSEANTTLILLSNSVNHYQKNRTFYNCSFYPTQPFTNEELRRVFQAHEKFHAYARKARTIPNDPPIRRTTLEAIRNLVNGSLYESGLSLAGTYANYTLKSLSMEQIEQLKHVAPHIRLTKDTISLAEVSLDTQIEHRDLEFNTDEIHFLLKGLANFAEKADISADVKSRLPHLLVKLEQNLQAYGQCKLTKLNPSEMQAVKIFFPKLKLSKRVTLRRLQTNTPHYQELKIENDELIFLENELLNLETRKAILTSIITHINDPSENNTTPFNLFENLPHDTLEMLIRLLPDFVLANQIRLDEISINNMTEHEIQWTLEDAQKLKAELNNMIEKINGCSPMMVKAFIDNLTSKNNEMYHAARAYEEFYAFIQKLPTTERSNLYQQTVLWHSKWMTVEEMLQNIKDTENNRGCIALAGMYFACLVINYDPTLKFSERLEKADWMLDNGFRSLRAASLKKILQDDIESILLHSESILFSILKFEFGSMPSGQLKDLSFSGFNKKVPEIVLNIFEQLKKLSQSVDRKKMVVDFNLLEKNIIEPAWEKQNETSWWASFSFWSSEPPNPLKTWLELIRRENRLKLFEYNKMYDQAKILEVVLKQYNTSHGEGDHVLIDTFLDDVFELIKNSNGVSHSHVLINLKLNALMDQLSYDLKQTLLNHLSAIQDTPFDFAQFDLDWRESIEKRLKKQSNPKSAILKTKATLFSSSEYHAMMKHLQEASVVYRGSYELTNIVSIQSERGLVSGLVCK